MARGVPKLLEQLDEQERVPAGRLVAGGEEHRPGAVAERFAHHLADPGLAERAGADDRRPGLQGQRVEDLGLFGLAGPVGDGDHDANPVEASSQVGQEPQGWFVRPLDVIDR